jgi:hypothetical protein
MATNLTPPGSDNQNTVQSTAAGVVHVRSRVTPGSDNRNTPIDDKPVWVWSHVKKPIE